MSENQKGPSSLVNAAMILILTVLLTTGFWWLAKPAIMWISFYCSYFMFGAYQHLSWLVTDSELQAIATAHHHIPRMKPKNYGIVSLFQLFELHGYIWRWVVIPALIYWGWKVKKGVVRFKFRREIKDVYDLIEIQSQHFPASAIIKGKDLLKTHPYVGAWATYSLPLDFARDHQLLWISKIQVDPEKPVDEGKMLPIPPFTPAQKLQPFPVKRRLMPHYRYVVYDVMRANALFTKQLGGYWKGADALPPLEKALYAVFVTQGNGKQEEAWAFVKQLAFSFREGKYDAQGKLITPHTANTKGMDELIAKYGKHPQALAIIERHAHTLNVMSETLAWARKKGRLMHANFLWLKPVNRTLWYTLCGQGGQCPYWEAAGPWAHAQVERIIGKRLETPMVLGAIEEMRRTMAMEHWIEPGEYSEEHQQKLVTDANAKLDAERERRENEKAARAANKAGGSAFAVTVPARQPQQARRVEDDTP
jgi:intracellular multiplication protein IcmP